MDVDLYVEYPPGFPDGALDEFLQTTRDPSIVVKVERHERGPQAGIELLLYTAAFLFISRSYFDGFLKEAGKDHYQVLKSGIGKLWAHLATMRLTVISSSPKKAADDTYSRTFSLLAQVEPGKTVKLLIPSNATPDQVEASLDAFREFLRNLYQGQQASIRFDGGMGLVTYNPATRDLQEVHALPEHVRKSLDGASRARFPTRA